MEFISKLGISTSNVKLYEKALTHTSYSNEHPEFEHYERL